MTNRKTQAAWEYHNATKHSWASVRSGGHYLDWSIYPRPFKIYPQLEPIPLPRELPQSGVAALSAIAATEIPGGAETIPDLATLAHLLFFSAGITKHRQFPGGEIYFRAAACTGALYEIELYVVCAELPGLAAGTYHFNPADFALRRLRAGDYRGVLAEATADEPAVARAPAILISTGTYWRNAWKYQARTYRHFGWDNGTLHANLLAACAAQALPVRVVCGFADDEVNRLLDLDTQREVALALVPVGRVDTPPPAPPPVEPLGLEVVPPSKKEKEYPAMREMHAASSLAAPQEVAEWRPAPVGVEGVKPQEGTIPLAPLTDDEIPRDTLEQVILRRGSTRQFAREAISFRQLSTVLDRATRSIPADFLSPGEQLNELYLIVNAVEALASGAYYFHRKASRLELLKKGNFRREVSYLGLEQELPGDASVCIFFLADLAAILNRLGNRGYRAVQLEAGILGGKLYLATYSQRLGATGLTFYDDDVVEFFSPHASGKSTIFLVAIGQPRRKALVPLA
jgi:SagB-type dehydrogenase family enzyme